MTIVMPHLFGHIRTLSSQIRKFLHEVGVPPPVSILLGYPSSFSKKLFWTHVVYFQFFFSSLSFTLANEGTGEAYDYTNHCKHNKYRISKCAHIHETHLSTHEAAWASTNHNSLSRTQLLEAGKTNPQ